MNKYIAIYQGRSEPIHAEYLWEAVEVARGIFNVPRSKRGLLSIELAERSDGSQVTTTITS